MNTVGKVIERLKEFDPNLPILLSVDPEGNRFREVWDILPGLLDGDGDIWDDDYSGADVEHCVVIWT